MNGFQQEKHVKKGYQVHWTSEMCMILNNRKPYIMYELGDIYTGEKITGDLYVHEIECVNCFGQPRGMFYQIEYWNREKEIVIGRIL